MKDITANELKEVIEKHFKTAGTVVKVETYNTTTKGITIKGLFNSNLNTEFDFYINRNNDLIIRKVECNCSVKEVQSILNEMILITSSL
jgi:hypothetical protein